MLKHRKRNKYKIIKKKVDQQVQRRNKPNPKGNKKRDHKETLLLSRLLLKKEKF